MFDLKEFDDDFAPAPPMDGGADDLTDGTYEFEIRGATTKFLESQRYSIVTLNLSVVSGGKHDGQGVALPYFLKDSDAAARLGRDLKILGFDTHLWTKANGRPLSVELPKALACLKGIRFSGKKTTTVKQGEPQGGRPGKTFHNLFINKRSAVDGLPATFGPSELDAAADADAPPF
jgi:hypothetical protein